jgi:hypothetical protein
MEENNQPLDTTAQTQAGSMVQHSRRSHRCRSPKPKSSTTSSNYGTSGHLPQENSSIGTATIPIDEEFKSSTQNKIAMGKAAVEPEVISLLSATFSLNLITSAASPGIKPRVKSTASKSW